MSVRKQFDPELYARADRDAKAAILRWFKTLENVPTPINTTERKDFDITCKTTVEKQQLYEVEIKYIWQGEWPDHWKEVRIPHRKKRLLDKWQNQCPEAEFMFIVFRGDCKKAWKIDAHVLLTCEVKEVANRNVTQGELFYHIPVIQAELIDIP